MFDVSESTRLLLPVERERVEPAALLAPERLVEAVAQHGRLALEPVGELAVAPDLPRQLGHAELRVVDVALHLAGRDRPDRLASVVEELRVVRVLPRLVLEPALRPAVVLDEAVAVEIAVLVDPAERAHRRLAQGADERGVVGPAPHLREQDEEERRRVDRAVVAREPGLRGLAGADLVDDLPRLGVCERIVLRRLEPGERDQSVARQLGSEDQRLEARDQRVAAEHGHEPRHPGREELAARAALVHAQRGEVGDGAVERRVERRPAGAKLRHLHPPGLERRAHALELGAEAQLGAGVGVDLPVRRDGHVDPQPPRLARIERQAVAHRRAVDLARRGEEELRDAAGTAVQVGQRDRGLGRVERKRREVGQRVGVLRVAEREVPVLHAEDVREVGPDLEGELELEPPARVVADDRRGPACRRRRTARARSRARPGRVRRRSGCASRTRPRSSRPGRRREAAAARRSRSGSSARGSACRSRRAPRSSRRGRRARRRRRRSTPRESSAP